MSRQKVKGGWAIVCDVLGCYIQIKGKTATMAKVAAEKEGWLLRGDEELNTHHCPRCRKQVWWLRGTKEERVPG